MERRAFLTGAAAVPLVAQAASRHGRAQGAKPAPAKPASAGASEPRPLIRPKRLVEGNTVGLISPATPVSDPDLQQKAERTIRHFGWKVKWGRSVGRKAGYFGSTVEDRLADLHAMFEDPEVDAVFAIRGGYGASHLLDGIDYDLIRRHPKVFIGYSDITALHLAIHQQTGLVTFHAPVPLSPLTGYSQKSFRQAITEARPLGRQTNPPESSSLRPLHPTRVVRPGRATGPLAGGNLTLISTLMGTPYEIETRDTILFLEDVGEEPYRIDRMLTQLRLAGKLEQAAGIIFGECVDCGPSEFRPFVSAGFSLGEVIDAILGPLRIPVLFGLTIGHTADQMTLPLGLRATLDTETASIEILESAVRA